MSNISVKVESPVRTDTFTVNAGTSEQAVRKALNLFFMTTRGVKKNQVRTEILNSEMVTS